MGLNKIESSGSWGKASSDINSNFDTIGSDLTKLKNATLKNKGYFATAEDLRSAYPSANVGDYAYVGSVAPYQTWQWKNNAWSKLNDDGGGVNVDLNDYYPKSEIDSKLTDLASKEQVKSTKGKGSNWANISFTTLQDLNYKLCLSGDITDATIEGQTSFIQVLVQTKDGANKYVYNVSRGGTFNSGVIVDLSKFKGNIKRLVVEGRWYEDEELTAGLIEDTNQEKINDIENKYIELSQKVDDNESYVKGVLEFNKVEAEKNIQKGTIYNNPDSSSNTCLYDENFHKINGTELEIVRASDIKVRILEYDKDKTLLRRTGYGELDSVVLGANTEFVRICADYSERGYGDENPITVNDYKDGDFGLYISESKRLNEQEQVLNTLVLEVDPIKIESLGYVEKIMDITKTGEHPSSIDRILVNIPAKKYSIVINDIDSGNTGVFYIHAEYSDGTSSQIAGFNEGVSKEVTITKDIVSLGVYKSSVTSLGRISIKFTDVYFIDKRTLSSEAAFVEDVLEYEETVCLPTNVMVSKA